MTEWRLPDPDINMLAVASGTWTSTDTVFYCAVYLLLFFISAVTASATDVLRSVIFVFLFSLHHSKVSF
jgi:hypothetical protein